MSKPRSQVKLEEALAGGCFNFLAEVSKMEFTIRWFMNQPPTTLIVAYNKECAHVHTLVSLLRKTHQVKAARSGLLKSDDVVIMKAFDFGFNPYSPYKPQLF